MHPSGSSLSPAPLAPGFSQHPDHHRPERPVLLAVDQELAEGPRLRVAPELSDAVGALEVGQHQDVEEFGAGSGTEGVQALPKSALQLIGPHLLSLRCADLEVALAFRRNAHQDLA
jgi:hypothetical protein